MYSIKKETRFSNIRGANQWISRAFVWRSRMWAVNNKYTNIIKYHLLPP